MTLVLTNVTEYGVVIAADDAITERYGNSVRILQGATKLFAHYGCRCGLATWGLGALPNPNREYAPISVEFIVKQFVSETQNINSLPVLLDGLVERLNGYPKASGAFMIDIGGCIRDQDQWLPVVFQIGNCEDPYDPSSPIRLFTLRTMRSAKAYDPTTDTHPIANGLQNVGLWVHAQFDAFVEASEQTEGTAKIPGNTLEKRQAFLGSLARAVSDIQLSMNLSRSIGPRMLTLSVSSSDGRIHLQD